MDYSIRRIITALLIIIITTGVLTWYNKQQIPQQFTIGLVYVPSMSYHQRLNKKLKKIIKNDSRFNVTEFTPSSLDDQLNVSSICMNAIDSTADILISTGITCSQTIIQSGKKRSSNKPIIFAGVNSPVDLGLISSLEIPGGNATGLFIKISNEPFDPIELLRLIKPKLNKLLLPYIIAADGNEPLAHQLHKKYLESSITITLLPISNLGQTLNHITHKMHNHDGLMYLATDYLAAHGPALGKLASQHNITMFAGSTDGAIDAAIAFAENPKHYAEHAVTLIKRILINKENPGLIPVQTIDGRDLIINTKLCDEQDLHDIDIPHIIKTIESDDTFSSLRGHIIIN